MSIEFLRFGGLSSVNHKDFYNKDSYHSPPLKHGCYCFIKGFIEPFLVAWKIYDKEGKRLKDYKKAKRFSYEGKVWTHIFINDPSITYYRNNKTWYETDTESLPIIIKKYIHNLNKEIQKSEFSEKVFYKNNWKGYSKDQWEIFIEKI